MQERLARAGAAQAKALVIGLSWPQSAHGVGGVEKLGASPMNAQKSDPGAFSEKIGSSVSRVTRLGHAEVVCGGEEALPVLLGDPTRTHRGVGRKYLQVRHPFFGGTEGHCACALLLLGHLRRHGSRARQSWCGGRRYVVCGFFCRSWGCRRGVQTGVCLKSPLQIHNSK